MSVWVKGPQLSVFARGFQQIDENLSRNFQDFLNHCWSFCHPSLAAASRRRMTRTADGKSSLGKPSAPGWNQLTSEKSTKSQISRSSPLDLKLASFWERSGFRAGWKQWQWRSSRVRLERTRKSGEVDCLWSRSMEWDSEKKLEWDRGKKWQITFATREGFRVTLPNSSKTSVSHSGWVLLGKG